MSIFLFFICLGLLSKLFLPLTFLAFLFCNRFGILRFFLPRSLILIILKMIAGQQNNKNKFFNEDFYKSNNNNYYQYYYQQSQHANAKSNSSEIEEACKVLGVPINATKNQIQEAYHRLMKKAHPDCGGSSYLASKINKAREVLMKSQRG